MELLEDLILNAALVVALSGLYALVASLMHRYERLAKAVIGLLFGLVTVVGMTMPVEYAPGLIYDARSIVITLAGLFGGGTAVALAAAIASAYRVLLGGVGVYAGVATIIVCAATGLFFRRRVGNHPERLGPAGLYGVGVVAHVGMLASQFLLPRSLVAEVLPRIWIPVLVVLPVGTVLTGLILRAHDARLEAEERLRHSEGRFRAAFHASPDSVNLNRVADGKYIEVNEGFCNIMGYEPGEVLGRTSLELGIWVNPEDREALVSELDERGQAHIRAPFRAKNGDVRIGDMRAVVVEVNGENCILSITRDITEVQQNREALERSERELRLRAGIAEAFLSTPEEDLFETVLNEVLQATGSRYGIFGYLNESGDWVCPSVTGDVWERCEVADKGLVFHHDEFGGIWGTAIREKRTVVKEGSLNFPDGHVVLRRAVAVPIVSGDEVLASVVVGDKDAEYTEEDVRLLEMAARYIAPILDARLQRDCEERRSLQAQEQLVQAQKMESIGRLAGGIAHDFNNMLNVILGHEWIVRQELGGDHPLIEHLEEIRKAGRRAESLTRQLLVFSRKETLSPEYVEVCALAESTESMLRRLIGEHIRVNLTLSDEECWVWADRAQLEQVVVNLAVNARYAMPEGGTLDIEVFPLRLDEDSIRPVGVEPGEYVLLTVSDTGHGMTREVRERIFEPFFSTKPRSEGTGLGLAMAQSVVSQSGGHIEVESEPGRGATFRVYLPRSQPQPAPSEVPEEEEAPKGHGEQILVVEDEESVRRLTESALRRLGYDVITAADGEEALSLLESSDRMPALIISDVIMPGMNGKELAERIHRDRPEIPILFMSGYSDAVLGRTALSDSEAQVIRKPIDVFELARAVQGMLVVAGGAQDEVAEERGSD